MLAIPIKNNFQWVRRLGVWKMIKSESEDKVMVLLERVQWLKRRFLDFDSSGSNPGVGRKDIA